MNQSVCVRVRIKRKDRTDMTIECVHSPCEFHQFECICVCSYFSQMNICEYVYLCSCLYVYVLKKISQSSANTINKIEFYIFNACVLCWFHYKYRSILLCAGMMKNLIKNGIFFVCITMYATYCNNDIFMSSAFHKKAKKLCG